MPAPPLVPASDQPLVLAVFTLTYLGVAAGHIPGLKIDRTGIAMLGAIALMIFSRLSTATIIGFVNWPTMLLLFGFFVLSAQLRLSGLFDVVATAVARRLGHPARFLLLLMLATAGLSAFLNNDIVCFVFTPIVTAALQRQRLNPIPFLIALAISSNLGAAATLVGNAQDMLIAQTVGLEFGRYSAWCIAPVLAALGSAYGIIWVLARGRLAAQGVFPVPIPDDPPQPFDRRHTVKGLAILIVVIGLFFTSIPKEIVALTAAAVHLASPKFKTRDLLKLVDWPVLVLFMGLFIVTGAFQATAFGDRAVGWLALRGLDLGNLGVLAWVTAGLSNLINNSAAVMLLLRVAHISSPTAAYTLALANSFGGNLIVVGAVSNIIVVQQARDMGVEITFGGFARIGVPVTLIALAALTGWVMLAG